MMDADQLRGIAKFLDLFQEFASKVTGFASDHPACFARELWNDESKKIILDNLKNGLEKEILYNSDEIREHPEDAKAMINLYQLVITQLERKD